MKKKIIFAIIMLCFIPLEVAQSKLFSGLLPGLERETSMQPVVVVRPDGGYTALWFEAVLVNDELDIYEYKSYYTVMDSGGNNMKPKQELTFWKDDYYVPSYSEKSVIFLSPNKLLIIALKNSELWKTTYRLEKLIIDISSGVVSRDSNKVNLANCSLVRNSEGHIYAIQLGYSRLHYLEIIRVEPAFGKVDKLIELYPRRNYMKHYLSSEDNVVTMTSQNNLLVIGRVWSMDGKPVHENPDGWNGLPNRLACFLIDTVGNYIIPSYEMNITELAFRKIPGMHLGGNYGQGIYDNRFLKGAGKDLDFSHLPDGSIVLSVTGLDEKNDLCVYQVKFSAEGILIQPDSMEVVKPRVFPTNKMLFGSKVVRAVIGLGELPNENAVLVRREYVLFGFDEEGNFYKEREVWREKEE